MQFLHSLSHIARDPSLIIFGQLAVAMFLGLLLGTERSLAHKSAGMRTYALVSLGCALLVIISNLVLEAQHGLVGVDPLRMAAGIVTGIGFIGAGLILHRDPTAVTGVTTSAGLWVAAAIGIAVGFHFYLIAVFATLLTLFTFTILWYIEQVVEKWDAKK